MEEKEEEQGQGTEREEIPHCRESLLRSKLPHAVSQSVTQDLRKPRC